MSFYSYKNSGSTHCPCSLNGNEVLSGLNEKICIQVQRVYDSCLMQEQLKEQKVTLLSYGLVPTGNGSNCDLLLARQALSQLSYIPKLSSLRTTCPLFRTLRPLN